MYKLYIENKNSYLALGGGSNYEAVDKLIEGKTKEIFEKKDKYFNTIHTIEKIPNPYNPTIISDDDFYFMMDHISNLMGKNPGWTPKWGPMDIKNYYMIHYLIDHTNTNLVKFDNDKKKVVDFDFDVLTIGNYDFPVNKKLHQYLNSIGHGYNYQKTLDKEKEIDMYPKIVQGTYTVPDKPKPVKPLFNYRDTYEGKKIELEHGSEFAEQFAEDIINDMRKEEEKYEKQYNELLLKYGDEKIVGVLRKMHPSYTKPEGATVIRKPGRGNISRALVKEDEQKEKEKTEGEKEISKVTERELQDSLNWLNTKINMYKNYSRELNPDEQELFVKYKKEYDNKMIMLSNL